MKMLKKSLYSGVVAGLMVLASSLWAASPPENPATPPAGINLVNADQVQALQGQGAVLVDTRKAAEYAEGSLKGAISVVYDEKSAKDVQYDASQDAFDMSKISDKAQAYVVFCNGPTCWRSYKAAVMLAKNGYQKVNWYRDGFPDWKARNLPIE
ncbi:MAG: rhodanese-like domain-containing protein [Magnetococcales bacterium]|nr:rhodanese-like domain-containing protein [Magnetococcales bacterium]